MDAADIMGIGGRGGAAPAARKTKEAAPAKPKGVSREVWQITQGYSTDPSLPPAPLIPSGGFKEKRKGVTARKVRWEYTPFTSSARADGLKLMHWVKRMEGGAPLLKAGSNGGDVGGDYAFAKYNKKIELLEYNDTEWNVLKLGGDPEWSRAETDYLFALCRQYDLRFVVIADRYAFEAPPPPADGAGALPPLPPKTRSVHELKARYFGIARRLVASRADSADEVSRHPVMATPYNRVADLERREALERLLARTAGAEASEAAELAAAAEVEARRKAEVDAARAAGLPLPAFCRPAGRFPELRISMDDLDVSEEPPGPELPTPRGQSAWPPPGAYARGAHTTAMAPEALAAAANQAPGGRQRDKKALEGINKRVDLAMEELGVRPPHTATRAVCRAWFALRTEVLQLLELRGQLARKNKEPAAAAAAAAAAATPGRGAANPYYGGGGDGMGSPSPGWGHGAAPGSGGGVPGSPSAEGDEARAAKREHKRKAPSRYDMDPSPPKAKRPKSRH